MKFRWPALSGHIFRFVFTLWWNASKVFLWSWTTMRQMPLAHHSSATMVRCVNTPGAFRRSPWFPFEPKPFYLLPVVCKNSWFLAKPAPDSNVISLSIVWKLTVGLATITWCGSGRQQIHASQRCNRSTDVTLSQQATEISCVVDRFVFRPRATSHTRFFGSACFVFTANARPWRARVVAHLGEYLGFAAVRGDPT